MALVEAGVCTWVGSIILTSLRLENRLLCGSSGQAVSLVGGSIAFSMLQGSVEGVGKVHE